MTTRLGPRSQTMVKTIPASYQFPGAARLIWLIALYTELQRQWHLRVLVSWLYYAISHTLSLVMVLHVHAGNLYGNSELRICQEWKHWIADRDQGIILCNCLTTWGFHNPPLIWDMCNWGEAQYFMWYIYTELYIWPIDRQFKAIGRPASRKLYVILIGW